MNFITAEEYYSGDEYLIDKTLAQKCVKQNSSSDCSIFLRDDVEKKERNRRILGERRRSV